MYVGSDLWRSRLKTAMVKRRLSNGREVETFAGLPETLYGALAASAAKHPNRLAVSDDLGRNFTYAQLLGQVDRFASCLAYKFGVKPGDHTALMLYGSAEFCVALLALIKLGAPAVMLPTKFRRSEIRALAERADLKWVICDESFGEWFEADKKAGVQVLSLALRRERFALEELWGDQEFAQTPQRGRYEDFAVMMFTSGTTSLSKGVMLTNYNLVHAAGVYRACFGLTEEDKTVIPVPTYMITGLSGLLGTFLLTGGAIYLFRFFSAEQVLHCVKEKGITFMHAAPTVYSLLLEEKHRFPELPSLRCLACGGSRTPAEKIKQLHQWLPNCEFHTVYGMTETASPGTILPEPAWESRHLESNGIPVPGLCYQVLDDQGRELPWGETGELAVSGTNVMAGYYKLETPLFQNGWLRTGDIGYFTEDGYCYVLDRKKDMINRGGEKIVSMDVENELLMLEGVADAAVVGIPHPVYGDVPAALIRLEKGAKLTEEGIQRELKKRLAGFKIPVKICFAEEIPLTPNGKVDKKRIRTMF